jgi:hypothetical protein
MPDNKLSNWLTNNKKGLVAAFGFVLFTGIFLYLFFQPTSQETKIPSGEVSPTPSATELSPTPVYIPKEEILKKLPVVTDYYTIEYFPVPQKFMITILKNPYEKYRTEVEKWFKDQGVDPADSRLFWGSAKGVAPKP